MNGGPDGGRLPLFDLGGLDTGDGLDHRVEHLGPGDPRPGEHLQHRVEKVRAFLIGAPLEQRGLVHDLPRRGDVHLEALEGATALALPGAGVDDTDLGALPDPGHPREQGCMEREAHAALGGVEQAQRPILTALLTPPRHPHREARP